ncbi:MAG TPA: hypothetical protein VI997_05535, partial [Candidatus Thermoplasmatota archaeon]|nr:hypothetical protein [Candidatus Thermoplasmatota archaeon]
MKAPLRPPTAGALARIERGDLAPFGVDATANAGSGVLEAYLDERGRRASHASWRGPAALGAVSGAVAAVAVVAAGLVLGVVVAFAWHVTLVAALARRLGAREAATASAGALAGGAAAAGLLFLPAGPAARPAAWLAATVGGALLGLGFAALVRRAWLVDSPLPWPATHGHVRLLALAETASVAAAGRARHALTLLATAVTGAIAFALARGAVPLPARIWDAGLGAVRLPAPVPGLGFAFSALAA